MEFRFVAKNGDRLIFRVDIITEKIKDVIVNGLEDHPKKDEYRTLFENRESMHLIHKNEMSPEEYEWCFLEDGN